MAVASVVWRLPPSRQECSLGLGKRAMYVTRTRWGLIQCIGQSRRRLHSHRNLPEAWGAAGGLIRCQCA
ncbi:hypothetical protein PIB30_040934 [Stylosanthes scabra]|uniref:Uncharacterized protein n=1 Tax=Stylosanthes scabra TaxID=79078 RepID=A0ABU6ZDH2_9FABA|nr:hypothetical protein [Stylosanthes scabra]